MGRILNSDIWELYEKAMSASRFEDNYIGSYINSLGIKYQEKNIRGQSGSK